MKKSNIFILFFALIASFNICDASEQLKYQAPTPGLKIDIQPKTQQCKKVRFQSCTQNKYSDRYESYDPEWFKQDDNDNKDAENSTAIEMADIDFFMAVDKRYNRTKKEMLAWHEQVKADNLKTMKKKFDDPACQFYIKENCIKELKKTIKDKTKETASQKNIIDKQKDIIDHQASIITKQAYSIRSLQEKNNEVNNSLFFILGSLAVATTTYYAYHSMSNNESL